MEGWRSYVQDRQPDRVFLGADGRPHVEVYFVSKPRLRIHRFLQSDPESDPHDHPWDSWSLILDGGYREATELGVTAHTAGEVVYRPAEMPHHLYVDDPVWTLLRIGPYVRQWGFHTPSGWVSERHYPRVGTLQQERV